MIKCKIALIGHSGTGKTSCLKKLAEMDSGLGTGESPNPQKAMDWMLTQSMSVPVLVIGVHKCMLIELAKAKIEGTNDDVHQLLFVYLYKRKDRLSECLQQDVQERHRSLQNACDTLSSYEELDTIFRSLADHIVDTSDIGIDQVAREIKCLEANIVTSSIEVTGTYQCTQEKNRDGH